MKGSILDCLESLDDTDDADDSMFVDFVGC